MPTKLSLALLGVTATSAYQNLGKTRRSLRQKKMNNDTCHWLWRSSRSKASLEGRITGWCCCVRCCMRTDENREGNHAWCVEQWSIGKHSFPVALLCIFFSFTRLYYNALQVLLIPSSTHTNINAQAHALFVSYSMREDCLVIFIVRLP